MASVTLSDGDSSDVHDGGQVGLPVWVRGDDKTALCA